MTDELRRKGHNIWAADVSYANPIASSCPRLSRASTSCIGNKKVVDGRAKAGADGRFLNAFFGALNSWLENAEASGVLMTMKPWFSAVWQELHPLVRSS